MTGNAPIEPEEGGFCIDATLLGELLDVPPSEIPSLMRANRITGFCERGIAEDEGRHQITFFYKGRRARVSFDETGRALRRSVVDFGIHHVPPAMRSPGR